MLGKVYIRKKKYKDQEPIQKRWTVKRGGEAEEGVVKRRSQIVKENALERLVCNIMQWKYLLIVDVKVSSVNH